MKPIGTLQLFNCITKNVFRHPNPKFKCLNSGFLISLFEENRIQLVDIDTQHFAFCCQLAVDPGYIIIAVTHKYAQKFQISAADQVACRKCVPEQMRMEPINPGFLFQFRKK